MCGRFSLSTDKDDLQSRYGFVDPSGILLKPRYNIAPTQQSPVVTVNEGTRVLAMMRWGLVPYWAKDASIGYKLINARAETLAQKSSFKKSFREKRCLVLADGFYEWRKTGGKAPKIPLRFVLRSREPFAFAGLWDSWQTPEGDTLFTFTIITTEANELMSTIHDRMPVILHQKDEDQWLDPELKDVNKLIPLLAPYPSDLMDCYEVSPRVNSPKNDDPECILPVSPT